MTSDPDRLERAWFGQQPWRCRVEWGRRGAAAATARSDVLVVVDALTFSTAVATALHRGVTVFPCLPGDEGRLAEAVGAEATRRREDVPSKGRFSLSPGIHADHLRSNPCRRGAALRPGRLLARPGAEVPGRPGKRQEAGLRAAGTKNRCLNRTLRSSTCRSGRGRAGSWSAWKASRATTA